MLIGSLGRLAPGIRRVLEYTIFDEKKNRTEISWQGGKSWQSAVGSWQLARKKVLSAEGREEAVGSWQWGEVLSAEC